MMRDKFANQASTSTNIVSGFALDFISDQKAFTITLILHNNDLCFQKTSVKNRYRFSTWKTIFARQEIPDGPAGRLQDR
jgi:hypothetical protein